MQNVDRYRYIDTDIQKERQIYDNRWIDRQIDGQLDRQIDGQKDRQIDRDRQIDKQRQINRDR